VRFVQRMRSVVAVESEADRILRIAEPAGSGADRISRSVELAGSESGADQTYGIAESAGSEPVQIPYSAVPAVQKVRWLAEVVESVPVAQINQYSAVLAGSAYFDQITSRRSGSGYWCLNLQRDLLLFALAESVYWQN